MFLGNSRDLMAWREGKKSMAGLKMMSETDLNHQFSNVVVKQALTK